MTRACINDVTGLGRRAVGGYSLRHRRGRVVCLHCGAPGKPHARTALRVSPTFFVRPSSPSRSPKRLCHPPFTLECMHDPLSLCRFPFHSHLYLHTFAHCARIPSVMHSLTFTQISQPVNPRSDPHHLLIFSPLLDPCPGGGLKSSLETRPVMEYISSLEQR